MAASVIGIVVGFPALRLKGIYLAIATLGFGEMVRSFFLVFTPMGGAEGFHGMQHVALGTIWIWTAGILLVDFAARAFARLAADAGGTR